MDLLMYRRGLARKAREEREAAMKIVKRLRDYILEPEDMVVRHEAADEIERLLNGRQK